MKIIILSKQEAYKVAELTDLSGWLVISILDPGVSGRYLGGYQITMRFDDITFPIKWHIEPPKKEILELIQKAANAPTNILIHCTAGISRSTAIGWGILVGQGMPPMDAAKKILEIRSIALPNKLIVSYICEKYNIESNPFESLIKDY